jgi:hypothetical protein
MAKVCPDPFCAELQPCPKHGRVGSWSANRDLTLHKRFARAVKRRDNYRCRHCGATEQLVAHHIRQGYDVSDGITVCRPCHRRIDEHAR